MVTGVRRQPLSGVGQYSISTSGALVYAQGANGDVGLLVHWHEGSDPAPLNVEPAAFLRFDVSPDEEKIAVVVERVDGEELAIYDLRTGLSYVWLRARQINVPCWDSGGERLLVGIADRVAQTWTILSGEPSPASEPDTLLAGSGSSGYGLHSCQNVEQIIGASYDSRHIVKIDISGSVPTLDTIVSSAFFPALSPDGRRLAHDLGRRDVVVTPFPEMDRLIQVAQYRYEPQWLNSRELVFWDEGGTFYRTTLGEGPNAHAGTPILWHSDPRFSDTPGSSYKVTRSGGLVYVQEPEQKPAAYLRVIPNWVEQMKRAVDEANR
jgi:hypothetical protein